MVNIEKIVLRALNSSKKTSPSTYIALRILVGDNKNLKWIEKYCQRRLLTTTKWTYNEYKWFKKIEENGNMIFRTFHIGSPTTLLMESYILSLLSRYDVFKNNDQNYSYHLSEQFENYNFSYYYKGYKRRNDAITAKLSSDSSLKAYIFDLTDYYPSIDKKFVYDSFIKHLNKTNINNKIKKGILNFVKSALDITQKGIPVNPDIGHLLGSIALKTFDDIMYSTFNNNYFRYVDDIVIIANQSDIKNILKSNLPLCLELNNEKEQVLTFNEWKIYTEKIIEKDDFNELINDIQIYISSQDNISLIQKQLRINNISIPIYKLYINSRYAPWQSFIKTTYNSIKLRINNLTVDSLVNRTINLKKLYLNSLKNLESIESTKNKIHKRNLIKRYHYYINRLIYLCDSTEYESKLLPFIPNTNDFFETTSVINAILKNDISKISKIGGKSIFTFSEIWKSNNLEVPKIDKKLAEEMNENVLNSLGIFSINGVINLSEIIDVKKLKEINYNSKCYIDFCNSKKITERELDDLSYHDEMMSLRLNISFEEVQTKLFTRYKKTDKLHLSGLHLDDNEYYSL